MALNIGDVVDGKYRIVRLLGEGGMGAVYEGENTRIHRRVAIKVLHSNVAHADDAVQRFEREAQAAGRIGNQHIVEVLDLGNLPGGDRYMVMEYLEGENLADRIRARGRLSAAEMSAIGIQLLEGLAAAHDVGIIHRDLKPDNIFLIKRGAQKDFVKIVDFGISKFSTVNNEFSMTRTGAVMGTPYYMSPEQAKGTRNIDHRVDLYAAGVILYEGVAGQVPFDAETFNELLFKIVLEEPPPVSKVAPELDAGFAAIVDKARVKDPGQRFQTARDFLQALVTWSQGRSPAAEWNTRTVAGPASEVQPVTTAPKLGKGTANAWSNTGEQLLPARQANKRKLIAFGAAALLGAGALAFVFGSGPSAEEEAARALAARAEETRLAAEREAQAAQAAAEKAKADAQRARQEAEAKVREAEQAAAQARGEGAKALEPTTLESLPKAEADTPAAAKPVAKPAAKPSAIKPAPAATGTHRKIRTSL